MSVVRPLLVAMLVAGLAACDFAHVREGSQMSLEEHLASLARAQTQEEAVTAVRRVLTRTGIGMREYGSGNDGVYSSYALTMEQVRHVARRLVRYNTGDGEAARTPTDAYAFVVEAKHSLEEYHRRTDYPVSVRPRPLRATLDEVLTSFRIEVRHALERPEQPRSALLLITAAADAERPAPATRYAPLREFSPLQYLLFSIWLDHHSARLPLVADPAGNGANGSCPAGTKLLAHFEEPPAFEVEHLNADVGVVSVQGDEEQGRWSSKLPVDRVILLSEGDVDVQFSHGAREGTFTNAHLFARTGTTNEGIEAVQFCTPAPGQVDASPPTHTGACSAGFSMCLNTTGSGGKCQLQMQTCLNSTHDQGDGS